MQFTLFLVVLVLAVASAGASQANPIRKVVKLMQNMQEEVEAEGGKEKELFDKFMCFCSGSGGDLDRAVEDSRTKIKELAAKLKSETAEKAQTDQDLEQHKKDREGATKDSGEATVLREKENSGFQEFSADSETNLAAMEKAIPALEGGMGGSSLLQMPSMQRIHKLVETSPKLESGDRRMVLAFLENNGDYVPQGGQIVGILKQMKDEMAADLKQATTEEQQAAGSFNSLKAAKTSEIKLASEQIETKTARSGELAVAVVQTKDQLEDEKDELADTEKFSATLKAQCGTKQQEWDERSKTRNDEIAAISEAIKILNDDDALDVFKKTMPSMVQMPAGFLQLQDTRATPLKKAQGILAHLTASHPLPQLRLMLLTLNSKLRSKQHGRSGNLGDVVGMIDGMVELLGKQQAEDDKQRDWCRAEFDKSEDEEKAAHSKIEELKASIDEMTDMSAQLTDEIAVLSAGIASLDKAVAEATEQRKEEHMEYAEAMQLNGVAKTLVDKARNRLHKFYNPTLYKKAPEPAFVSEQERTLMKGATLLQVSSSRRNRVAPPDAPETFTGEVQKNEGSSGVIGMMDEIMKDLESTIQEAQMDEARAQKDYNELMANSQQKRAESSKSTTNKEANKANLESKLLNTRQSHRDAEEDRRIVEGYINDLHGSCDFMLDNYAMRKEARAGERDSLNQAKAVLSGASFGFF